MQPVTVQPSSSIPQPVGHSAWGDTLGDRVVWMVGQQHQGVDLHLNPPALGPLEVRLSMNDGQANLTFSTQHVNVKEAIENATPRLREMLGDSGISLGSVSVNVGSFTQQQPQQQGRGSQPGTSWSDVPPIADFSNAITGTSVPLSRNGMVDTFA
jgi:flagellar hook-length control protein FliK